MRNQAGEKGKRGKARAEPTHRESSCEAEPGREGKEEQKAEELEAVGKWTKENGTEAENTESENGR